MEKNKLDLIFKSYDIRGVFGETLTPIEAFKIGSAFAEFVDSESIIVGHDGRISRFDMLNAVASGIQDYGKEIIYVGMVPTDIVYSLSGLLQKPGIVITASHNPKEYNGLKFCNSGAVPIGEFSGLNKIKEIAQTLNTATIREFNSHVTNEIDLYFDHLNNLVNPEKISKNLKFGIDGGNGAIGSVFERLSKDYQFDFLPLYLDVDGTFPNHPADPSNEENLQDLISLVLKNNLNFGVAFDGDADRAVFVDDLGRVLSGSIMTTIIADYLSRANKNLKVVHNINVSPHALSILKDKNINLFKCKVGHSNIKALMREVDADFGGEHSAHFYYKDNYFADSAIVTLLMFMSIISAEKLKVSDIVNSYNFPPSSGEINFKVNDVSESIDKITKIFEGEFDFLDGISLKTADFWFNVRGSNTEPKLRINIEAKSHGKLKEVLDIISSTI